MRLIFILILVMPTIIFCQQKYECKKGDRYNPGCDSGGHWLDCDSDYDPYTKKVKGQKDEQWCVCKSLKDDYGKSLGLLKGRVSKLEASDKKQNAQIAAIQKKDAAQDVEIENIKGKVNNLEVEVRARPEPTKEPEKFTEKSVEKSSPKKDEPSLGAPREAPTVKVPVEPSFFFEPELGLFANQNISPEFNSKWLYTGEVGARFVIEPHNWHGFGIFAHPKYIFGLNKTFIPESDGTAYVQPLQNLSGGLTDACIFYKPIKYTEVFAGYAFSLSKGTEHHSGFLGGLESGWDFNSGRQNLQLRAQVGLIYKHDLSFFGGVVARLPINFKPKA